MVPSIASWKTDHSKGLCIWNYTCEKSGNCISYENDLTIVL